MKGAFHAIVFLVGRKRQNPPRTLPRTAVYGFHDCGGRGEVAAAYPELNGGRSCRARHTLGSRVGPLLTTGRE